MLRHALPLLVLVAACRKGSDEDTPRCPLDELPVRAFDPTPPASVARHQPAGEVVVPLRGGASWTLSEQWSGCDSYLFLPHGIPISELDRDSWWGTGVAELTRRSPPNVHYFFVADASVADPEQAGQRAEDEIGAGLAELSPREADHWRERLHVVAGAGEQVAGLVGDATRARIGRLGWAIDRAQRIRTLGSMADVEAYARALADAGHWRWEARLYSAAHEAAHFNFEARREARLDAEDVHVVEVLGGGVEEEFVDAVLRLPSADVMAGFDTLEVDVRMECPRPEDPEFGNCGAWDYLAHLWLLDAEGDPVHEVARFITTYHRESRWVVDASHALAWLRQGGEVSVRYGWAPPWNTQPTGVTLRIRLSDRGKGAAPREIVPLFSGGTFGASYNDDRPPVDVAIPADVTKVELVSLATGHGMEGTGNCAEFCVHTHRFEVGDGVFEQRLDEAGSDTGCRDDVGAGTVPNQGGTWWFGRSGWCPGREVDPFVVDVTSHAPPGGTVTVRYGATVMGGPPRAEQGNAVLSSWLVLHR